MNTDRLREHLRRLEAEIRRITDRLNRLEHQRGDEPTRAAGEARAHRAIEQRKRLERLIAEGRRLLGEGDA